MITRSSARAASAAAGSADLSGSLSHGRISYSSANSTNRRSARRRSRSAGDGQNHSNNSNGPLKKRRVKLKNPPAELKKDLMEDDKKKMDEEEASPLKSCVICLSEPERSELASINGCEHLFCFTCITKWADRENTCPLCKERFTKIDLVHKSKKQRSKRVKRKDQSSSSDLPIAATATAIAASAPAAFRLLQGFSSDLSDDDDDDSFESRFLFNDNASVTSTEDSVTDGFFLPISANEHNSLLHAARTSGQPVSHSVSGQRNTGVVSLVEIDDTDDDDEEGEEEVKIIQVTGPGLRAESPLEIEDDSSDDGEEGVEVIQITTPV